MRFVTHFALLHSVQNDKIVFKDKPIFGSDLGNEAVKKIEFKYVEKPTTEVRRFK